MFTYIVFILVLMLTVRYVKKRKNRTTNLNGKLALVNLMTLFKLQMIEAVEGYRRRKWFGTTNMH